MRPETFEFKVPIITISLPHLNYKVKVRHIKKENIRGGPLAFCKRDNRHQATLHLPKWINPPMLAHELVHVLQFICADRHILFDDEREHMGYIMQHCMGRILGMVWDSNRAER